jgi:hypothetical protein
VYCEGRVYTAVSQGERNRNTKVRRIDLLGRSARFTDRVPPAPDEKHTPHSYRPPGRGPVYPGLLHPVERHLEGRITPPLTYGTDSIDRDRRRRQGLTRGLGAEPRWETRPGGKRVSLWESGIL